MDFILWSATLGVDDGVKPSDTDSIHPTLDSDTEYNEKVEKARAEWGCYRKAGLDTKMLVFGRPMCWRQTGSIKKWFKGGISGFIFCHFDRCNFSHFVDSAFRRIHVLKALNELLPKVRSRDDISSAKPELRSMKNHAAEIQSGISSAAPAWGQPREIDINALLLTATSELTVPEVHA